MSAALSSLRNRYRKLTPFERACLALTSMGGVEREEDLPRFAARVEALAAPSRFESFWTSTWYHAIVHTLGVAMVNAAESLLSYVADPVAVDSDGNTGLTRAYGWLLAVERLERETGAPFTRCERLFCCRPVLSMVRRITTSPDFDADEVRSLFDVEAPYRLLRMAWDSHWGRTVNASDAWRRLPPLEDPGAAGTATPDATEEE